MLLVERVLGDAAAGDWHERLHEVVHAGGLEFVFIEPANLKRRRFRARSDGGTDVAISLPRDAVLFDGAVLYFSADRAIVLKVGEQRRLRLRPVDRDAALELGHLAGHLHWRVGFEAGDLLVAVDGDEEAYWARLKRLLEDDRVRPVG
ncbi:urease accessory protein UreE [Acuticoccus sp. 2012]|uniref:Urease accessory protein UreE n=1 Tax=Acuticoccus mangrovi TaxID=2796142 RepID=A0A934IJZ7_9HYPH|nr:urease accessory protein UreE [Acuticoccus mangrovi]